MWDPPRTPAPAGHLRGGAEALPSAAARDGAGPGAGQLAQAGEIADLLPAAAGAGRGAGRGARLRPRLPRQLALRAYEHGLQVLLPGLDVSRSGQHPRLRLPGAAL